MGEVDNTTDRGFAAAAFVLALFVAISGGALLLLPTLFPVAIIVWGLSCVAACLAIFSNTYRPRIITMLETQSYPLLYEKCMAAVLAPVLRFFGIPFASPIKGSARYIFGTTFQYSLWDRALLIAVAYPILLIYAQWLTGQDGALGDAVILAAEPRLWIRILSGFSIAFVIYSPFLEKILASSPKRFFRSVSGWMPVLAFAVAFAVAGVFAFAFAGAGVYLYERGQKRAGLALLYCVPLGAIAAALLFVPWENAPQTGTQIGLFLFLGLLPIVNAVFDWLSYGVTLALARAGLARVIHPFIAGVLDLVFAVFSLLALGAAIVIVVSIANAITGVEFAPLERLLPQLHDWRTYWWLWAIAFSTLLPTLLHLLIASFSMLSWINRLLGQGLILWIDGRNDSVVSILAALALGSLWVISLGGPVVIGAAIWMFDGWQLIGHGFGVYFEWLLDVALWIAGHLQ